MPQKESETLHHLQRKSHINRAEGHQINANIRRLKCYTPIPSGGSIMSGSTWDSRSIATQTEDEDEEKMSLVEKPGKEAKVRSRQPRWKRSVRKRKSIAVMETTNSKSHSGIEASPAKSENGILATGQINRGYSVSPIKHKPCHSSFSVNRQRSASTLPYGSVYNTSYLIEPKKTGNSNSLDNLLANERSKKQRIPNQNYQFPVPSDNRYSVLVKNIPDMCQENTSPTENILRSKTVRAEKRKQRDRREKSIERCLDIDRDRLRQNYHEGQHIHPSMLRQRTQSIAAFESRYCYTNPIPIAEQMPYNSTVGYNSFNPNDQYISPNASKSSASSLSGSASNYQHRSKSMRPSVQPTANNQHHLFHHQNGLSVKTPLRSCPSLMETETIPFIDDSDMLYARAEPYQPSLSSELELESINSKSMSQEGVSSAIASFQLLGLLLPPSNRRKLQLLLKFMRRLASKEKLKLAVIGGLGVTSHQKLRNCNEVVLDVFTETIIRPNQEDSNVDLELSRKIVQFFMDHYEAVWTPPTKLRKEVEERVSVDAAEIVILANILSRRPHCHKIFLRLLCMND